MQEDEQNLTIPVVNEQIHADVVPVPTGGVRVTKRVHTHDEVIQQELRKTHVEVKRVQMNKVVDGPQPTRRSGSTLIIPVVEEALRIEKQWVVKEEIHITETEQRETVQQPVTVAREEAIVERVDEAGNPTGTVTELERAPGDAVSHPQRATDTNTTRPSSIVRRGETGAEGDKRVIGRGRSLLKGRRPADNST